MNRLIAWFAHNHVAANLLMLLFMIAGVMAIGDTKKELLPNFDLDLIQVVIPYSGAAPSEVEESVLKKAEPALIGIPGVESIQAIAKENYAAIGVNVRHGFDVHDVREQVKVRLEAISSFPESVKDPIINIISLDRDLVANVVIYGDADERSLKTLATKVREDLLSIKGISQVDFADVRPYEINIELSELALERYGIPFSEVASAIQRQSLNVAVGAVDTGRGKASITAKNQALNAGDFEEIEVRTFANGGRILLKDIAHIVDGFGERRSTTEFNGKSAVYLSVFRVGSQDIMQISEEVYNYIAKPHIALPEGIKIDLWQDIARHFTSRVSLLVYDAITGLAIVFVLLVLFLRFRLSFWVCAGIPVAYLGSFWFLHLIGGSINMVSLFAFVIMSGIMVDHAIVISENIHTHQKTKSSILGAIEGAQEVAAPVLYSILATAVMFIPILFIPGVEGSLMRDIPIVVLSVLIFSLIESFFILPAHLSSKTDKALAKPRFWDKWFDKWDVLVQSFLMNQYRPFIIACIKWRYMVTGIFLACFILMLAMLSAGWLKVIFMSEIEADIVYAQIRLPVGTQIEETTEAVKQLEKGAIELKEELEKNTGEPQIKHIVAVFGNDAMSVTGSHTGAVIIEMTPNENRTISGKDISKRWRELVGKIPNATRLSFEATLNKPGPAIDLQLTSADLNQLRLAVGELRAKLSTYSGTYGSYDSLTETKQEVNIKLKPLAHDIGLKASDIAMQVRYAFHGTELQSVQRGQEEIKVVLRYPEKERKNLWFLENMHLLLPTGGVAPLSALADLEYIMAPIEIVRNNGKRTVNISAFVDEADTASAQILREVKEQVLDQFEQKYPGLKWEFTGAQKQKEQFKEYMARSFTIALAAMYFLMAAGLKSYVKPMVILYAVPFGMVGALFGHFLFGLDVTLWSVIGIVAVSGIVVNDNIVLLDCINRKIDEGEKIETAIVDAGIERFIAIFLIAITTVGGVSTLILEKSVQAQFLVPTAVSIAFGDLFATFISLILVPVTCMIFEDIKRLIFGFSAPAESKTTNEIAPLPNNIKEVPTLQNKLIAIEPPPSQPDKKVDWISQLELSYDQGYQSALKGKVKHAPSYSSSELIASWEAGWEDGVRDKMKDAAKHLQKGKSAETA